MKDMFFSFVLLITIYASLLVIAFIFFILIGGDPLSLVNDLGFL